MTPLRPVEPKRKGGKNGAGPHLSQTVFHPGEEGMARGQSSRSDAGLGDWGTGSLTVLQVCTCDQTDPGYRGPSCRVRTDEMTCVGPSSSYML